MKLTARPRPRSLWGCKPPFNPLPKALQQLKDQEAIALIGDCFRATTKHGDFQVQQRLGGYAGGDGRLVCAQFSFNVIRRIREKLIRDGVYPRSYRPAGLSPKADNFVDRSRVPAVDLHVLAISELWQAVAEVKDTYRTLLRERFGLTPPDVLVSFNEFEMTFDVPCDLARCALSIYREAWESTFLGATVGAARDDEREARDSGESENDARTYSEPALFNRHPEAVRGSKILHAHGRKGNKAKLYAKADRWLRFESRLTGEAAGHLLGRRIRLSDLGSLQADLGKLSQVVYPPILEAQARVSLHHMMSLPELVTALCGPKAAKALTPILKAWYAGEPYQNQRSRSYGVLARMRDRGVAKMAGKLWRPTPRVARALSLIRWRATLDDGGEE